MSAWLRISSGRAREFDPSGVEQIGAVDDVERHPHVLLDQKNRHAEVSQLDDESKDLNHQLRRKSERRFVHQ